MDLGKPLVHHGAVAIGDLHRNLLAQPDSFWEADRASRTKLAGNRPGNAVYFYNDQPPCVHRRSVLEAQSGFINTLRYPGRPVFAEVQALIETHIVPRLPQCDVFRVQLAQLPPGDSIKPHRDSGLLAMSHRLHVPIVTHAQVDFVIGGEHFFLEPGQLYDLNNVVVHSVENRSDVMRVHLLVDLVPRALAQVRYYDTEEDLIAACNGQVAPAPQFTQ